MHNKQLQSLFATIHQASSHHEINSHFQSLSNLLMNQYVIKAHHTYYRLTEIEFYYYTGTVTHQDIFAHQNEIQQQSGVWYAHRSGLDITFGNQELGHYGGILIRGVNNLSNGEYSNGPITAKRELFKHLSIFDNEGITLKQTNNQSQHRVFHVKRVGLNRKKDKQNQFHDKAYRHITNIDATTHSYKNKTSVAKELYHTNQANKDELEQWFWKGVLS